MFLKSIRWKIQIWHTTLLAVIVITLLVAFYRHEREIIYQALDQKLQDPITALLPHLTPGPGARRPPHERPPHGRRPRRNELPAGFRPPGPPRNTETLKTMVSELAQDDIYVVSWRPNNTLDYRSQNAPSLLPPQPSRNQLGHSLRSVAGFREAFHIGPRGNIIVICGTSIAKTEQTLSRLQLQLFGIGAATIFGGFFVGWWLTSRSLHPIKTISTTAQDIAHGDLGKRINTEDTETELGQLATILNDTFGKLESSMNQQIRFTADASHEMRTPISVILAKSQFALSKERSKEDYKAALEVCANSAQHMRELIESLMDLSSVDSGEFTIDTKAGNLTQLMEDCLEFITPLAKSRNITIIWELAEVTSSFDDTRLRQALVNILSNAVKYNTDDGTISVSLAQDDDKVTIEISDTGIGIATEDLPHLFDRFYRVDKARTTQHGSTGLGLAIANSMIEAHHGKLCATSQPGKGTTFTVTLPRTDSF